MSQIPFEPWKTKYSSPYAVHEYTVKQRFHKRAHKIGLTIPIPDGQICEVCKRRKAEHRHHPNYGKPRLIGFVCFHCHHSIHKKYKGNPFKCRSFAAFWETHIESVP